MAEANPLKATFFALRKRERGGVLTSATIAVVIIAALLTAAFVAVNFAALGPVIAWYGQVISASATGDSAAITNLGLPSGLGLLALTALGFTFLYYLLFAMYEAGCLRWIIRGESSGLFGLAINADTWRVYGTYWIWFFLNIAFSIVMAILQMVAIGVAASAGADPLMVTSVTTLVFLVLQYGLMIYFGVRLAPAAATSIARQKMGFFKAWTVTRGRFWALFGAFFIAWIIYILAFLVIFGIGAGAIFAPIFTQLSGADPSTVMPAVMQALMANLGLIGGLYAVLLVVGMVFVVLMYGINARAAIAAVEDGKIEGLLPEMAKTFD